MAQLVRLPRQNSLSMLVSSYMMACPGGNCSGHGECMNGTCLCEIQYDGEECLSPNIPYYVGFATVFFILALVCMIQLIMCIVAEYHKMKSPSFLRACRITTQKLLYFLVFLAAIIRGAYFTSPTAFREGWSSSLMSAYYPLLLSGSSLLVCFWAEVFHLRDIRWERNQFLSKSFLGFVTFNILTYSLLIAELITTKVSMTAEKRLLQQHIFNGCYAVLLFIVVIFFLIYGVEVFFKVRGGFLGETVTNISTRTPSCEKNEPSPVSTKLCATLTSNVVTGVDISQLNQSRVGLLAQAFMLIIVVGFLFSETLSEFWKSKAPIYTRNWHDITFRIVEIGVALWFPCVLWNCMSPDQLWILNPRRLLKKLEQPPEDLRLDKKSEVVNDGTESLKDCWICYDVDRTDAGPLIQPCHCSGDVSSVHHDCLRRWLVESSSTSSSKEALSCKVCKCPYEVEKTQKLDWQNGFDTQHWLKTAVIVTVMCVAGAGAWAAIQLFTDQYIRLLSASLAVLVWYICARFLGMNTVVAYNRAKVSGINIVSSVPTMSAAIEVVHQLPCDACQRENFVGFRYKCQKCHNYQMCQDCFWRGQISGTHTISHQVKEYTTYKSPSKQMGHTLRKSFRCVPDKPKQNIPRFPEEPEKTLNLSHIVPPSPLPSHNGFNEATYTPVFDSNSVDSRSQRAYHGNSPKYTLSLDSNRMDDEHRLIARYAARLALQNQSVNRAVSEGSLSFDSSRAQRELISQLESKNREILREIQRLRRQQELEGGSVQEGEENPALVTELRALRLRKDELENHLQNLQDSRRQLMVQLEGLMKMLKNHQTSPRSAKSPPIPPAVPPTSRSAPPTPVLCSDGLSGLGGDVRNAFGTFSTSNTSLSGSGSTNSLGRSLRNDLLVAADSVTNAMSTLVRELNSEGSEEESEIRRPLELGDEWRTVPSYYD